MINAKTTVSGGNGYFNFDSAPVGNRGSEPYQTNCYNEIIIDKLVDGEYVRQIREITYGGSYDSSFGIVSYSADWGQITYKPDGFGANTGNGRFNQNNGDYKIQLVNTIFSLISLSDATYSSPMYSSPLQIGKKYHIIKWNSNNYQILDEFDAVAKNVEPNLYIQLDLNESGAHIGCLDDRGNYSWIIAGFENPASDVGYIIQEYEPDIVPIDDKFIPQLSGVKFKIEGSPAVLKASLDGGETWQTVTLS